MSKVLNWWHLGFVLLSMIAPAYATADADSWTPVKTVEFVVGTSPGSGTDASARLIQKICQEKHFFSVSSAVVNKPGGGSAVANAYIHEHEGDPHYLTVASYNLVTNYLTGKSKLGPRDFVPIAQLFNEYVSFNVRSESSIRNAQDLVDRLKQAPQSIAIGISSSVGGANHIALALAMKAAGVNIKALKTVVFNSGGEAKTALLGGHIDVQAVAASVIAPQLRAGKIRTLAISAPHRLAGVFAAVPTWRELGIDAVASNWRNIVAPPGLTDAQVAYWDNVFGKLVKTAEWRADLQKNYWEPNYMDSKATARYLDHESDTIRKVLVELDLAKLP